MSSALEFTLTRDGFIYKYQTYEQHTYPFNKRPYCSTYSTAIKYQIKG